MTVFISRAEPDVRSFFRDLRSAGARVTGCSLIRTVLLISREAYRDVVGAGPVDYLVFTSPRAVEHFAQLDVETGDPEILCAGAATAAAANDAGFRGVVESGAGQAGITEYFARHEADRGRRAVRVVFPRSSLANPSLAHNLRRDGFAVTEVDLYRPVPNDSPETRAVVNELAGAPAGIYAFTSASTFDAFVELACLRDPAKHFDGAELLAMGFETSRAIERRCHAPRIAEDPSIDGLTRLAVQLVKGKQ